MSGRQLHRDWPAFDPASVYDEDGDPNWLDGPTGDLLYALNLAHPHQTATPLSTPIPKGRDIRLTDVAEVSRYRISYHDEEWRPGGSTGSELSMQVVGKTTDGRWFSVEAWNDYTGWGCGESADVRVGGTEEQVVRYGLSQEARQALGYKEATR